MTKVRRELLDALLKYETVAEAVRHLGITEGAGRQRLFMLRRAYTTAKEECEEYERYKHRMTPKYL